jgi:hypothetical protein
MGEYECSWYFIARARAALAAGDAMSALQHASTVLNLFDGYIESHVSYQIAAVNHVALRAFMRYIRFRVLHIRTHFELSLC